MLARFIRPGPVARRMAKKELAAGVRNIDRLPWREPALAVERARIATELQLEKDRMSSQRQREVINLEGRGLIEIAERDNEGLKGLIIDLVASESFRSMRKPRGLR